VIKDSSEGMTLQTSNSKYIINNSLNNMTSYGVKITGGGNNLTSAIVTNTKGVYISGQSNTVRGCQISGNTYGVYSEDSSLSVIMDSIINKSKTYDIFYLHSSPAQIVNSNYTNLSLNWNFDLKVVRGSTVMENASVIIKDVNGVVVFSGKTGPDGRIPQQLISQYENLSGVYKNHNPYTINVTKTNFTANITQLNITNNMDVTINIDTEVNFTMPFTFYMSSPQINKTYFQDDLFNNTYLYLLARSNSNMVSCSYLGTAGAAFSGNLVNATTMPSKDFEKYFDVTAYSQGAYIMTVTCTETTGRTNSTQISFNVYYNYTCINSNDCTPVQVCSTSQHICLPLDCGCGYPENHTCVTYQCCNSTMCDNDQECNITSHTCKNVTCECGYVQDHYCHPYECCNDMQCGPTQICMMNQHICVNRTLYIIMPDEDIFVGKNVSVLVKDQDGEPVSNVRIDVSYKSGRTEEYITDGSGFAYVIIRESGPVQIKAAKERYPAFVILKEAQEGFDWVLTGVVGAVVAGALIVVFFVKGRLFTHTSPVKLEKTVSGDVVMLRVKNRTKEALRNISVIDQVPRGSLTGWNIRPVIRPGSGSVETLIWDILILDPKEEVVIEYRAMQTEQGFSVMVSDKTYYSK
jgi:parallel beta-helix repeat protein